MLRGIYDADKILSAHAMNFRGYGGMVDAEDLKSFGYCNRVGSSPTIPTRRIGPSRGVFIYDLAQCTRPGHLDLQLRRYFPDICQIISLPRK